MTDTLDLGRWCILRTSSADTLPVAESLANAGFEVWTPVERKLGLSLKRDDDKRIPIMRTFVFADASGIPGLARLALIPQREHRRFWLFRFMGGYPLIADTELVALRREEERRDRVFARLLRRGKKGPVIAPGTELKLTEGAFAGLPGTVRCQQGQYTLVDIPGFAAPLKIASIMLADVADDEQKRAA